MSDSNTPTKFGQLPSEPKKNAKIFNIPVKIAPYLSTQVPASKPKEKKLDPFSVTFEAPKGGT